MPGFGPFNTGQRRDILESLDDRYSNRSMVITIQMLADKWHELTCDLTLSGAILG